MEIAAVVERVERIAEVRSTTAADAATVQVGLVAVREARAWLDAQHAGLVAQLQAVSSFPEAAIAEADRTSVGAATTSKDRAETLAATPKLADALGDGAITAGHVDAVTRTSTRLDPGQREELLERADALVDVAKVANVDEFRRRLELEAKRLQRGDGMDRLERQRRATRLSTWVDAEGMWNLRGRFDPVTGVKLDARLQSALETLFAVATPDTAPADPVEKQHHLRALALASLVDGAAGGSRPGRGEFVAVIDADAPGSSGPVVEWSIPVELSARVIAELAGEADVHAVVVRNGVVLYAPGELDLGRATRLANRAQRRALRGLYSTCGIPGCNVGYGRCELHHVIWWRRGGRTDLDNLLPVCSKHHAKIHHDDWVIELGPQPRVDAATPRRHRPHHRTTRATNRRLTGSPVGPSQ
jgi:hypothetical protein